MVQNPWAPNNINKKRKEKGKGKHHGPKEKDSPIKRPQENLQQSPRPKSTQSLSLSVPAKSPET